MKLTITFFAMLLTTLSFGQLEPKMLSGVSIAERQRFKETDTIPKVFYVDEDKNQTRLKVYLNGNIVDQQVLNMIDLNLINDIKVHKELDIVDKSNYDGILEVTLKNDYQPKLISLNELQEKYIKELDGPILFMLNQDIIHADYDKKILDERYLMKIDIEKVRNEKESLFLNIINLTTRTKKNLEKANTIVLRGDKSSSFFTSKNVK